MGKCEQGDDVATSIVLLLTEQDSEIRMECYKTLRAIGPRASAYLHEMATSLDDSVAMNDPSIEHAGFAALVRMGGASSLLVNRTFALAMDGAYPALRMEMLMALNELVVEVRCGEKDE
jgi:hypothetical protein